MWWNFLGCFLICVWGLGRCVYRVLVGVRDLVCRGYVVCFLHVVWKCSSRVTFVYVSLGSLKRMSVGQNGYTVIESVGPLLQEYV